jgi:hypothetical protein
MHAVAKEQIDAAPDVAVADSTRPRWRYKSEHRHMKYLSLLALLLTLTSCQNPIRSSPLPSLMDWCFFENDGLTRLRQGCAPTI